MLSSNMKLLLISALAVAWWANIVDAKSVTLNGMEVTNTDENQLTWDYSVENGIIESTIGVKKDCSGKVQLDVIVYKDGEEYHTMTKDLESPADDIRDANTCESIDSPDINKEEYSLVEGNIDAKNCDVRGMFESMPPGDYISVCNFLIDDKLVATVTLDVVIKET